MTTAPVLRPYQEDVIAKASDAITAGDRRLLLVAPTGSGKTVIASELVRRAVSKGNRVLFLAHRRELIGQAVQKLYSQGIDAGQIIAGVASRLAQDVQVASVQTLWARAFRGEKMERPPANMIIVDEAHHVRARTYRKIIEAYPDAAVIGLTATPCRGDGRGLGGDFDIMVECPSVAELVALGFLVPTRVFAPSTPDLRGVRTERGDYVEAQLAERVNTPKLVGDIVEHWHRLGEDRKTVVFATGVAHSVEIRNRFRESGVSSEHIDGSTPVEEREKILRDLSVGKVKIVTNCMVLTEGWDSPDVSCIVLARPTKQLGLYRQMIGRVLRPAPGKTDALVLDHGGLTLRHGFAEDDVAWSLAEDTKAENHNPGSSRGARGARSLTHCPECSAIRLEGDPCGACGWRPRPKPVHVHVAAGELSALSRDGSRGSSNIDQRGFYQQLRWIGRERGWSPKAPAAQFRERFGNWPPFAWNDLPMLVPDPATRSWVRSRMIAYAKGRAA